MPAPQGFQKASELISFSAFAGSLGGLWAAQQPEPCPTLPGAAADPNPNVLPPVHFGEQAWSLHKRERGEMDVQRWLVGLCDCSSR